MKTKHTRAAVVAAVLPLTLCACHGPGDVLSYQEFDRITVALARSCRPVTVTERGDCYRSTLETVEPKWEWSADSDVFKWLLRQDQHISALVKTGRMQTPKATRLAARADLIALRFESARISARASAADVPACLWCASPGLNQAQEDYYIRKMLAFSKAVNAAASPPLAPEAKHEPQ